MERAFGKKDPTSIAQYVAEISSACIQASTQFRLVLDQIELSRETASFEEALLRGRFLKEYEAHLKDLFERKDDTLSATHLQSI